MIRSVEQNKRDFLPLLLLGDEQQTMIDRYLDRGELFICEEEGVVQGVCVVTDEGMGLHEIKNIAVAEECRRRGIGRELIRYVENYYHRDLGTLLVGTGESPQTLAFYRRCGFVESHRVKDFFTDHYDHPILEGEVVLRDMIYLKKLF